MSNEIDLGLGLQFDKATLNQLDIIVKEIKKYEKIINDITNTQKKYTESIKRTRVVSDEVKNKITETEKKAGELLKTQERINKAGRAITNNYKSLDGTLTSVTKRYDQQGQLINFNLRTTQKTKRALDGIAGTMAHNVTKMAEWAVAGGVLFGTIRGLSDVFRTLVAMETEAVNIAKVLPSGTNVSRLTSGAIDLSQQFGQRNVVETERAMQSWARMYKDVDDIIQQTRLSLLAATATDITFGTSVKALSAIMAEWNMTTTESIHVVDVLNEISNNYRTTAEDLAVALVKTGSGARASGLEFEELTGILTTGIQALGLTGEEIGTMWSRVMARIKGNKDAKSAFESLGINTTQGLGDILDDLMIKWDGLSKTQKANFAITVAGTHHWSKFVGIMDNFDTVLQATSDAYFSFGSAQKEVDIIMATTEKQINKLMATWQKTIHNNEAVLTTVKDLANVLETILHGFNELDPTVVKTIGTMGVLITTVLTLRGAYLKAKTASEALTVAQWALNASVHPITLAIGAVVVLGTALYTAGKAAQEASKQFDDINEQINELEQESKGYVNNIRGIDNLIKKYDKLEEAIENAKNKGEDHRKLQEKLNIVSRQLGEGLGLSKEEYDQLLSKDGALRQFSQNRMEEYLNEINAIQLKTKALKEQEMALVYNRIKEAEKNMLKASEDYFKANNKYLKAVQNTKTGMVGAYGLGGASIDAQTSYEKRERDLAFKKYEESQKILEELQKQYQGLEKKLKSLKFEPISLEDILYTESFGGDDLTGGNFSSFVFKNLTDEQIKQIQELTNKITKQIDKSKVEIDEKAQTLFTLQDGTVKKHEIYGDSKIISYAERIITGLSELPKEINSLDIDTQLSQIALNSQEEWQNLIDTIYGVPEALGTIKNMKGIYNKQLQDYKSVRTQTEEQIRTLEKQNADLLNQRSIPAGFGISTTALDKRLQENSEQLTKLYDVLAQISSKELEVMLSIDSIHQLGEALRTASFYKQSALEVEREYEKTRLEHSIAGQEFEGTNLEQKLREDVLGAWRKYAETIQLLMEETELTAEQMALLDQEYMKILQTMDKWGKETSKVQKSYMKDMLVDVLTGSKGISEAIEDMFKDIERDAIEDFVDKFLENFKKAEEESGDTITNIFESIDKAIDEMGLKMIDVLSGVLRGLPGLLLEGYYNAEAGRKGSIGGGLLGAGIGFLFGGAAGAATGARMGSSIGDFIMGLFGHTNDKPSKGYETQIGKLNDEIKEFYESGEKYYVDTWQKIFSSASRDLQKTIYDIAELIGTSIDDIAGGLANAFQSSNYMDFLQNWSNSLETMTRDGLIKAFLAQDSYQSLYKNLSNYIVKASVDGFISSSEALEIQRQGGAISRQMRTLYQSLQYVDMISPYNDMSQSGGSENYQAGMLQPMTFNIHITVNTHAMMGDEDDAREFAILLGNLYKDEIER